MTRCAAGSEALSCAGLGARFGLTLSPAEAEELAAAQEAALCAEGRIAFSPGELTELVRAFAPSPYAEPESWASLLAAFLRSVNKQRKRSSRTASFAWRKGEQLIVSFAAVGREATARGPEETAPRPRQRPGHKSRGRRGDRS